MEIEDRQRQRVSPDLRFAGDDGVPQAGFLLHTFELRTVLFGTGEMERIRWLQVCVPFTEGARIGEHHDPLACGLKEVMPAVFANAEFGVDP